MNGDDNMIHDFIHAHPLLVAYLLFVGMVIGGLLIFRLALRHSVRKYQEKMDRMVAEEKATIAKEHEKKKKELEEYAKKLAEHIIHDK